MTNDPEGFVEREEVAELPSGRARAVGAANAIIRFICGLFATALMVHIVLVLAGANFGNAFATFVRDLATSVTLGLSDLFTFGNEKVNLAANEGLAAVLWLLIGAALTMIIARVFMPELGERIVRRRIRR